MQMRRALTVALGALAVSFTSVAAATPAATALEGVPRVDHVVVLVLENESYSATWSPGSAAKYLNSLAKVGAFVPNYFATGHVSLDNYIAMTSGVAGPQIAPTYTDCLGLNLWTCTQNVSAAAATGSIADQVEQAGLTWKQYSDGTTAPCVHADYSSTAAADAYQGNGKTSGPGAGKDYADRHNAFLYYSNVVGDGARCDAHLRPFTDLSADLAAGTVPSYSFITPDTCNDGHDAPCADGRPGGLASADAFLAAQVPALVNWLRAHNGVLFVTFDEGGANDTAGCCTGGPGGMAGFGGQVGMVVLGSPVAAGTTATKYDHASLLRTTEDLLGISTHLNNAASATPITGIWTQALVASNSGSTPAASPTPGTPGTSSAAIGLPNTAAPSGPPAAVMLALAAPLLAAPALRRRRR
jgi:hypothetical protein